jgi:hypothetical protein
MAANGPGGIFISYRRTDAASAAGWLYDRLAGRFAGQLFKDVDSIRPGDDFVAEINRAVASCAVLLAVIGPRWLMAADARGQRRLDDPKDFVRLEIEAALSRAVRVVPVLVDGAGMPDGDDLPPSLRDLARRHAVTLSPDRFGADTAGLVKALEAFLSSGRAGPPAPGPAVTGMRDFAGPLGDAVIQPQAAAAARLASLAEGPSGLVRMLTVPRGSLVELHSPVAFSPDGSQVAAGVGPAVLLWQVSTGKRVLSIDTGSFVVRGVAFSPGGQEIASAGSSRRSSVVRLWDAATGRRRGELENGAPGIFSTVAYSADGARVAVDGRGEGYGWIQLWEPPAKYPVHVAQLPCELRGLAFSPDGAVIAAGCDDSAVRLCRVTSGKTIGLLRGHHGPVSSVGFSPDGSVIASAGQDGTVRLWSAEDGRPGHVLTGHDGPVQGAAFGPERILLASGGNDRTVRLWDARSGAAVRTLTGHAGEVSAVAFSPDGALLASASEDGTVRLWG